MNKTTFCETERKRLDKLNEFQLSNKYKKIGWSFVLFIFLLMIAKKFIDEPAWVKPLLSNLFLFGLLIVSISKEKIEDELIINLRSQSYRLALVFGILYAFIQPFISYLLDLIVEPNNPKLEMSYFQVLTFILVVQLAFFESLKRYR